MNSDVTVIIAAYNVERYIERAINSALLQVDLSMEVIVVDDASTDGTVAVASSIDDARIRIISLPRNVGPGAARNIAIDAANAPWIAVLDGDDEMRPSRLSKCIKRATQTASQVVIDNLTKKHEIDGFEEVLFPKDHFTTEIFMDLATFIRGNTLFSKSPALGYAKPVVSTDFIRSKNIKYPSDLKIGEDYIFLAEILASGGKCCLEHSADYLYTVRAGSVSHRLSPNDVVRMQSADRVFLERYSLDVAATSAQAVRAKSLINAYHFTKLVEAIKSKRLFASLRIATFHPVAAIYLWMPIAARLKRLLVYKVKNN